MPPPLSLDTTIVRWRGVGSVGPISSPELSCTNVRSPISAIVRPSVVASAAPIAVDTVPSIPATPRFDRTLMPCAFSPTSAASRTGFDAPSTSWSPGRSASATAAATCSPVVSGWALSWPRTASIACRFTSAQRCSQAGVRFAGGHRAGAGGLRVARHVGPARAGGQRVHRHRRVGQQRRHRPVQRRAAQHDHLLRAQQRQRHRVQRVLGGRRGRLGDRRQRGQIRVHTRAVPGDDDRVRRQVDVQRLVERDRRGVGPRLAAGPALRRVGAGPDPRRRRAPAARAAGCRTAPARRSRCENPWRPPALGMSPIATAR